MGPPDGTIIVSIAGKPRFPPQMFPPIHEKLKELGAQVQLSKFDDGDLWIVLNSGEMALAALSMDGLKIGGTDQINVKLKSPDWAYALKPHLSDFDLESFEVTAEEEALLGGTDGAVFEFAGLWNYLLKSMVFQTKMEDDQGI